MCSSDLDLMYSSSDAVRIAKWTSWSMFFYWTLLAISAISASYSEIIGHEDHALDYQFSLIKFRLARQQLQECAEAVSSKIVADLSKAALQELILWTKLHRARPMRMPF